MNKPTLLIFSFSPIVNDARVLKQVRLFADSHRVVTCGFGSRPEGSVEHIELDAQQLPTQLDGRLITLRLYSMAYWMIPAVRLAWKALRGRQFDIVIANDIETLPIALRLQPRLGVHADLHEHYPSMHDYDAMWKQRIRPYMEWLCKRYATRAKSVTTVSSGLQQAYKEKFGFDSELVPNATPSANLGPTPVHSPIRLVHSGAGLRNRQLEIMMEAVSDSDAQVTFDLFLTKNDPKYLEELRLRFEDDPRVTLRDPVPYSELIKTLNQYDVGVFVLPPRTYSYEWALPNKFFDFVQARLGILIGPSPEMARYIETLKNGAVAADFTSRSLRDEITRLTPESVGQWKAASNESAWSVSAEETTHPWKVAISAISA